MGERAPETSDPLISGGRGCGEGDEDVVSFFCFDGEHGARQKALRSRKNPRRAATTAAANRRFPIRFGHPERFRAVFASHEGGAGRRACARWTYLAQRDGASPVDVAHRALPGGRVSEGDDHLLPEQGLRKSGANRQENEEAFAHVLSSS